MQYNHSSWLSLSAVQLGRREGKWSVQTSTVSPSSGGGQRDGGAAQRDRLGPVQARHRLLRAPAAPLPRLQQR